MESREHVLSKVFSTSIQGSSKLSKSQWQQLRHDVEAISTVDSLQLNEGLNRIVKCLVDHTKKIAGKDWKPWIVPIQKQLESFGTDSRAKRDYLVFLPDFRRFACRKNRPTRWLLRSLNDELKALSKHLFR